MTLHDIEQALPIIIKFEYYNSKEAEVNVYGSYMGMIYNTKHGFYYKSQCYSSNRSEYIRRDNFLLYFNYVLLLSTRFNQNNNDLQIYKLEPKLRVVYK